ncbi:MAG: alkaline phosphatase [Thermodesulfobacteriota bacterium]
MRHFRMSGLVILAALLAVGLNLTLAGPTFAVQVVKNVIVMIPDGVSFEQYTLARWFKGQSLAMDEILAGAVRTYISDSVVADSAPTASAYATGWRTADKHISVGPNTKYLLPQPWMPPLPADMPYKPLATVLEGARLKGKATGIVATSRVSHATPAAYMAHVPHRNQEEDIMEQAVYQGVDVVFGGGRGLLLPKEAKGRRADNENLLEVLKAKGYQVAETKDDLLNLKAGQAFGLFASSHMSTEIDRPAVAPKEPSLAEMAAKAIELLSSKPQGFFLMIEGSQVDWADHYNDPAYLLGELLMFEQAVQAALDFAKKDGNTLLLVMPDHNTGGMSLGNYATSGIYPQLKLEKLLEPLKKMKMSAPAMWFKMGGEKTPDKLKAVVREGWGLEITDDEAKQILDLTAKYKDDPYAAFGEVLCPKYTYLGWTTHGHCGGDVPLASYGPGRPVGLFDGPEIGRITAEALGVDLDQTTARLFVEAGPALAEGKVTVDKTIAANPVVKVEYQGRTADLPVNKNLLIMGGRTTELEGVVVYAPDTGKVYLPRQAVDLIKAAK